MNDSSASMPCSACRRHVDASDNFCRGCGASLNTAHLPAVREPASVTVWQPQVPPVLKGAAVVAVGTVGQFLVRRIVSALAGEGRASRSRPRSLKVRSPRGAERMVDEAQIITETVMMRSVRIRRPA